MHPGPLPHFPSRDPSQLTRPQLPSPYEGGLSTSHSYHGPLSTGSSHGHGQRGFFSPPAPRPEVPAFPPMSSSSKDDRWPSSVSETGSHPRRSRSDGQSMGPPLPRVAGGLDHGSRLLPPPAMHIPKRHFRTRTGSSHDEDEEVDELVDDDDVSGGYQDPDVLSRPLQLLAYASTAAARKQGPGPGGYQDARGIAAAASLGLIKPPADQHQQHHYRGDERGGCDYRHDRSPSPQQHARPSTRNGAAAGTAASTLENGAWEYKSGRVRAVRASADASSYSSSNASREDDDDDEQGDERDYREDDGNDDASDEEGPHLGKRRRSDDESLPLPPPRRQHSQQQQKREQPQPSQQQQQRQLLKSPLSLQTSSPSSRRAVGKRRAAAGASRKGYFRFSLYSSKLDIDDQDDVITQGVVTLKEMEDLFDLFFNKINPSNFIFDPFLHSLAYVRARSKFLMTVIASHAARMSPGSRNAELAEKLEEHWRGKLLPKVLIGGYKSVEISQAFLLASLFHRPTHIIVEDRAWQHLGFAIRTATEVGVNIALAPPPRADHDNEQVSRRFRNRERLWICLVIAEGALSSQFGRPCTLSASETITQGLQWNREDFALPEDAALMAHVELRRIVERHTRRVQAYTGGECKTDASSDFDGLCRAAWTDLEAWKETWCPTGGLDQAGVGRSMAMGAFLVRWSPYSRLVYFYWRSHLNSFLLRAAKKAGSSCATATALSSPVAHDSMKCARSVMAILLDEEQVGAQGLALAPNAIIVMAVYAAVSALRLTKQDAESDDGAGQQQQQQHAWQEDVDHRAISEEVQRLAEALEAAGSTPPHRDGAATPYGTYLRSVLALFEGDAKSSSSVSVAGTEGGRGAGAREQPGQSRAREGSVSVSVSGDAQAKSEAGDARRSRSATPATSPKASSLKDTGTSPAALALLPLTTTTADLDISTNLDLDAELDSDVDADVDVDEAALSTVYASDSEVWSYLSGGEGAGAAGQAQAQAQAVQMWSAGAGAGAGARAEP